MHTILILVKQFVIDPLFKELFIDTNYKPSVMALLLKFLKLNPLVRWAFHIQVVHSLQSFPLRLLMQQMHEKVKTIVTSYIVARAEEKQNIGLCL